MNNIKRFKKVHIKLYIFIRERILRLDKILKLLPSKGLIYDLGCGYGLVSHKIASDNNKLRVIGMDLNEARIQEATDAFHDISNLKFENRDLTKNTHINKADVVILYDLLHHIPMNNQLELIQSCRNNLNINGKLLIKEIDRSKILKTWFTWILDIIMTKGAPVYYRKQSEWYDVLTKAGFTVTIHKIQSLLPFPHILLECTQVD